MTIAAAYRFDDKAIFVSDFRVTQNKNLHDTCLKFEPFEEIAMGLFLAGDIESWNQIIAELRVHINEISYENILDESSTFVLDIRSRVGACRREFIGRKVGAIGFIVDIENNRNKGFVIRGEMGSKVDICEIENNQFIVIGSAENVPNIQNNTVEILNERNKSRFSHNIVCYASTLRENLKASFNAAGSDSYQKLGVSPVMAIGILEGSSFYIVGEDVSQRQISSSGVDKKGYTFTRKQSGEIVLKDESNEVILNTILNMGNYSNDHEIFWIGFKSYDPSSQFGEYGFCYKLHQWFISEYNFLYRKLYKINFIGDKKLCQVEDIAVWGKENPDTSMDYEEQIDIYFILSDELLTQEIQELDSTVILEDIVLRRVFGSDAFNTLLKVKEKKM